MSEYNLFAGVDEDYKFPPEVLAALKESLNIRNLGAPMTTAERNALPTVDLDSGYYIFNTQIQTFQVWRADFEEWHDGLEAPGTQKWWPGSVVPPGWKKQDGSSLLRSTYYALFAAIGTTYGGSDTPLHFKLPSTGGRTLIDVNGDYPLGDRQGLADVHLTSGQMPKHQHQGTTYNRSQSHQHSGATELAGAHNHGYWWITDGQFDAKGDGNNPVYRASRNFAPTADIAAHAHAFTTNDVVQIHNHDFITDERGNNEAHENMQPYLANHLLIKY